MDNRIDTPRLLIRPVEIKDGAFIVKLLNSPKWLKYIGDRNVHTLLDGENYIREKMLPQLERLGFGNYVVIRKEDQVKMGTCGLYDREGLAGVDIGFAYLPEFEGNGYATEAGKKVLNYCRENFGLVKVSGITTVNNFSSQRLLKKLGLTYSRNVQLPGDKEELMLYEIEYTVT